jgi:hypothetical protein
MYGAGETRRAAALDAGVSLPDTAPPIPLNALAASVAAEVAGGN